MLEKRGSGGIVTDLSLRIRQARQALDSADHIIVGGGSGLSAAAGLTYGGQRFQEHFPDFIHKYGLRDMYSASFYPFETPEELWAHWARHIHVNRYLPQALPLYGLLRELVGSKSSFVITTNVESQFAKAGFQPDRLFEVQGNYAWFQCARACHDRLYDNHDVVLDMVKETKDCAVPTRLVPLCPRCGGAMDVNLRHNEYFVQDEAWHRAAAAYEVFLDTTAGSRLVCLELGVGFNTPGIIRYPFERMLRQNIQSTLIRLNRNDLQGFPGNESRTIGFAEDMEGHGEEGVEGRRAAYQKRGNAPGMHDLGFFP